MNTDVVAGPTVESKPRTLSDKHRAELHASGLTDETIERAGIYSARDSQIRDVLGWQPKDRSWDGGWVIPYGDEYYRVKLDSPRGDNSGKIIKYESPRGRQNRAYFPPGFAMPAGGTVVVTEGEKKCLAISQLSISCIGLPGVWAWQLKRKRSDTGRAYGRRKLISDLDALNWRGVTVIICFDSDAATNGGVQLAEVRLSESLAERGATALVARLPGNGDTKVGSDDFIVANGEAAFRQILDSAQEAERPPAPMPMDWARMLIGEHHTHRDGVTLRWRRDEFYGYTGRSYHVVPEKEFKATILQFLDQRGAKATPHLASDIAACVMSEIRVPGDVELPAFITDYGYENRSYIAAHNGLIDADGLTAGNTKLKTHTPRWFSTFALPYAYDPKAECPIWFKTLDAIFDGDEERVDALGEFFGYSITSDTSQHKILLLEGPARSGKSTILRAMRAVVGDDNCVSPCLAQLAERFGLQGLLGKRLATVNDAHLGHGDRAIAVLERVKAISGEDGADVDRKHLPALLNCRLRVRFALACNELPKFGDTANALVPRLLVLPCRNSFIGREDRGLEGKLLTELPGIFNWAVDGLRRLRANGRFTEPAASKEILADFARLTSPLRAFLDDCCEIRPGAEVDRDSLWNAWRTWCWTNGHKAGSRERLGSQLRTLVPSLDQSRTREGGSRVRHYIGVTLNDDGHELARTSIGKNTPETE